MSVGEEPKAAAATTVVDATKAPAAATTTPAAAPAVPEVAVASVDQKVDQNAFLVTVDQLDTEHFTNVRHSMNPDKIAEMRVSIKDQGQIQPIAGVKLTTGKIAVFAGYTRTEAFWQNVCESLIKKWNEENDLKSADPNYLIVSKAAHRKMVIGTYPEEFAKEKAKPHNLVKVSLDEDVKTPGQARMKSFIENFQRDNMSLAETFDTIEKMIEDDGNTAAQIARILKKTAGQISQYRRARKTVPVLSTFLVTPEANEKFDESDLGKLKENANLLLNELTRRLGIKKDDKDSELAVSLSHIREFSQMVVPTAASASDETAWQCPLTRAQAMTLLGFLVGADEKTFKLRPNVAPLNYGVFMSHMKTMAETTKSIREGKVEAANASPEAGTAAATEAVADAGTGTQSGTVDGLAAQQAATVSTGNAQADAAEQNADTKLKPASDKESQDLANALVGGSAVTDDDSELPLDVEAPPIDGETKRKVQSAPIQSAKLKEVNTILAIAKTYALQAGQPEDVELTPFLAVQAGALQAVQALYDILSLPTVANPVQKVATEFAESVEAYIVGLEEYVEKASKKYKIPAFTMERPVPPISEELASMLGITSALAGEVADDDVEEELTETGEVDADLDDANDDDLREIEGLAEGE